MVQGQLLVSQLLAQARAGAILALAHQVAHLTLAPLATALLLVQATLAPSIWKVLKFLGLASMWLAAVSGGVGVLLMATRSGV